MIWDCWGFCCLMLLMCVTRKGAEDPEVDWCEPGETAAMEVLMGSKNGFLTKRLKGYSSDRNNPLKPRGVSGLSPYLHFGQISAQRCALEARSVRNLSPLVCDFKFVFCFHIFLTGSDFAMSRIFCSLMLSFNNSTLHITYYLFSYFYMLLIGSGYIFGGVDCAQRTC